MSLNRISVSIWTWKLKLRQIYLNSIFFFNGKDKESMRDEREGNNLLYGRDK